MANRTRLLLWSWRAVLAIYWIAAILGYGSRSSAMGWIVGPETWLTNRVPDPIMFAFVSGLIFSTWLVPAVWNAIKHQFVVEPILPNPLALPTMGITTIANYILKDSKWGWKNYWRLGLWSRVKDSIPYELRRAGREYEVRFIGSPPNSDATVEIGRAYWEHAVFDSKRLWDQRNRFFTEVLPSGISVVGATFKYQHGSAPRADVMRTWPRASIFLKARTRFGIFLWKARYGFPKFLDEKPSVQTLLNDEGGFEEFIVQSPQEKALENLLRLRSEGISHRNKHITDQASLTVWISTYEIWRSEVLSNAKVLSSSLENWFGRLDQMQPPPANLVFFNAEHRRLANVMSEILLRMQRFQEKGILGA